MTDRELMQQALEALSAMLTHMGMDEDEWNRPTFNQCRKAEAALRERLAQPEQEPVALPEKIYEFVPTPEPVKWHHPECEGQCIACLIEQVVQEAYGSQGLGYLQRHLTTSPQRKPLTDEMVKRMKENCTSMEMRGAFADGWLSAEAAHGIKEQA